jgi:hypothetical protein
MASLTSTPKVFSGDTSIVDSVQQYTLGTKAFDSAGNEYIYMQGVTSCTTGSWVTYDEDYVTTLLAADAKGPVAVAMAAISATTYYGWFCVRGTVSALLAANCADNVLIGYESTAGYAGDGRAAGDQIYGAISRGATTSAAATDCQIWYPFVDDAYGS